MADSIWKRFIVTFETRPMGAIGVFVRRERRELAGTEYAARELAREHFNNMGLETRGVWVKEEKL